MSTRTIHWTEDTKTMKIRTDVPGFFIEFGQQMVVRVKNETQNQINVGTIVFLSGSDVFPTIDIADYSSYLTSEGTLGFVAHNMSGDTEGYVLTNGLLRNVNLSNFSDGDDIYLYTGGTFTNIKPIAPQPEVYLGTVIKSGVNGVLNVNIELGFELEELHNVRITNPTDGDTLVYDGSQSVWVNAKGNYKWTIDFMDYKIIQIRPTSNITITSKTEVVNTPEIEILVNGDVYEYGDPILIGDEIKITSNINSLIVLNITNNE